MNRDLSREPKAVTRTEGEFEAETLGAVDAVLQGLGIARAGVGAADVSFKDERDVVTATDVAVEDAIRGIVGEAFEFPVVGEERGGEPSAGSPYWFLDPICGTRNYASGIPLYCVNLALAEADQIVLAAVGDGSTGAVMFAELGRGAWSRSDRSFRRLGVSTESQTIIVEEGRATGLRREQAARFAGAAVLADRWDVLSLNTSLSLTYVATGRVAAYILHRATPLHVAAGILLVSEAGGTVSDVRGRPWTLGSDSVLASADPELHQELLDLLGPA